METMNKYVVGIRGGHVVILRPPDHPISKEDALLLAAWLVVIAEEKAGEFDVILKTVKTEN